MSRKFGPGRRPALLLATLIVALPVAADDLEDCVAANRVTPICGLQNPEDLEVLPDHERMIISEYGALDGSRPGALTVYNARERTLERLYPHVVGGSHPAEPTPGWGDPGCPGAPSPAFDPHGIHHSGTGGVERLLVVNHGGREAIELFELATDGEDGSTTLTWRGCVPAPEEAWLNDVVGLPGGGFAATHMMSRSITDEEIRDAEQTRAATGHVLVWQPDTGWQQLASSAGALPNGIEVSADAAILYVNYYLGDAVVAIDRTSGSRLWSAHVDGPDNSSWSVNGRLLIASHRAPLEQVIHCSEVEPAFCPVAYAIVAVDPRNGETTEIFRGGGAPFGGATVAVQLANSLYLGTFAGDRMAKIPLPP